MKCEWLLYEAVGARMLCDKSNSSNEKETLPVMCGAAHHSDDDHNVGLLCTRLVSTRDCLLQLQEAVAKHNASVRVRYPHWDPICKAIERCSAGCFNDMPLEIHSFTYAAEECAYLCADLPMHASSMFSLGIIDILAGARAWAGKPQRSARGGAIKWKRCISHVESHFAQEIGKRAEEFFKRVYALPSVDAKLLRTKEKTFWSRYEKLLSAHSRAQIDEDARAEICVCLARKLPTPICRSIARYVQ